MHWSAQDSAAGVATGVTSVQPRNIAFCKMWHSNSVVAEDSESSGTRCCATDWTVPDVAKGYWSVIFGVEQLSFAWPWRGRHRDALKFRELFAQQKRAHRYRCLWTNVRTEEVIKMENNKEKEEMDL
jgi:hypothetical protein